jgi:hypothetical protein
MGFILPIPDTCTKHERGYCSSACYGENLFLFLKNPSGFPRIVFGIQVVKHGRNGFDFGGKRFWRWIVLSRTPPRVVSVIGRGGPVTLGGENCPRENRFSWTLFLVE